MVCHYKQANLEDLLGHSGICILNLWQVNTAKELNWWSVLSIVLLLHVKENFANIFQDTLVFQQHRSNYHQLGERKISRTAHFWVCNYNKGRAAELALGKLKYGLAFWIPIRWKCLDDVIKQPVKPCTSAAGWFHKTQIWITLLGLNKLPSVCHRLRSRSVVPKREVQQIWIYNPAQLHLSREALLKKDFLLHRISPIMNRMG